MYKNKKIFCIILARKNSKGIKNKNIRKIKSKPLIWYPINAAKKSRYIDEIYFNSDCKKMSKYANKLGANVAFIRPAHLAKSNSSSFDVIKHHITKINLYSKFNYFILLEPTSPLTTGKDIDQALKKLIDNKNTSSLLCITNHSIPNKNYTCEIKGGRLKFLRKSIGTHRQAYDKNFFLTGNLYISRIDSYLKQKTFFQKQTNFMKVNFLKSIEIDTITDLYLIKKIIK